MKDIAVYTESFQAWPKHVEYAANIAAAFDAHLTGVCICPSPELMMPSYDAQGFVIEWADQLRELTGEARRAESRFLAAAREHRVEKASWQVAEGYVPECLAVAADWHDLLVLNGDTATVWGSPNALGDIMLSCDVACLIVPEIYGKPFSLDCVAIAWNGSMAALRAIHTALPLLVRARRIVLLESPDLPSPMDQWHPKFDIASYLKQRSILVQPSAVVEYGHGIGSDLLRAAAHMKADLLVMGGYGHTRLRERVLGGATKEVLEQTKMPIWMHH